MSDPSQPVTSASGEKRRRPGRPPLPEPADRDLAAEHRVLATWYAERKKLVNLTGLATVAGELGHPVSATIVKALLAQPGKKGTPRALAHHFDAIYAVLKAKWAGPLPGPIPRPPAA